MTKREFRRVAVVMAGGSGERFWPLSRRHRPKQLLRLTSPDETLLEESLRRAQPLVRQGDLYVATASNLLEAVRAARLLPDANVLAEPMRRNTLGGVVWTVANLCARYGDWADKVSVAMLTSDHKIAPEKRFREVVQAAYSAVEKHGGLATIGIEPKRPETGYGYIHYDRHRAEDYPHGVEVRPVLGFKEKPSRDLAEEYLESGDHAWNSGMLLFTVPSFLHELELADPGLAETTRRVIEALRAGDHAAAEHAFAELPNISIDYALLERSRNVHMAFGDFEWDDVGSLDALERNFPLDRYGNMVYGMAVVDESTGSIVYNDDPEKVVCAFGIHGLVVVATRDAVLICPKHETQRVKEFLTRIHERHL